NRYLHHAGQRVPDEPDGRQVWLTAHHHIARIGHPTRRVRVEHVEPQYQYGPDGEVETGERDEQANSPAAPWVGRACGVGGVGAYVSGERRAYGHHLTAFSVVCGPRS